MYIVFFNDTATTEIYTLSLHDALPIWIVTTARNRAIDRMRREGARAGKHAQAALLSHEPEPEPEEGGPVSDRKSTRLNSSHANISYAVFCLKKNIITVHKRYDTISSLL